MSDGKNLLRSSVKIGSLTFVSRILGFVRDVLMAALFGTGMVADAFMLAFRIPNLFRRLFGEGTLNAAFIPVYTGELKENPAEAARLVSNLAGILGVVLIGVTGLGVIGAPFIVRLMAAGWHDLPDKFALAVSLTRVLFPYLFFIAMAVLFGAVLNTHRQFGIPAASPALLNICWSAGLVAAWWFWRTDPRSGIMVVAWGVVAGGAAQLLIHLPAVRRNGIGLMPRIDLRDPRLREIFRLVLPGVFGLAVTEINMVVDAVLATYLREGSITALNLANRLMLLPLGVFGVSLATALLPSLSASAAENDRQGLADAYGQAMNTLLYVMLPVSVFLIMFSTPVVRLVFERGNFSAGLSTPLTAFALSFYAVGLFAYGSLKLTVQVFYAQKDTRTPVKVATVTMLANIVLNVAFMLLFEQLYPGFGLGGLALATAVSAILNAGILWLILRSKLPEIRFRSMMTTFFRIGAAAAAAGVVGFFVYRIVGTGPFGNVLTGRILAVSGTGLGYFGAFFIITYFLKFKELRDLMALKRSGSGR